MKVELVAAGILGLAAFASSLKSCTTPNGESAKCISVYKCNVFIDALLNRTSESVRFIRASQCGYEKDPMVCCGSVATFQPTSSHKPPIEHANTKLLPSRTLCSVTEDRILPGNLAAIDAFSWTALLEYSKNGTSQGYHCGGMLINERYVLTAAHCCTGDITQRIGELFRIRFGEYNLTSAVDCEDIYGYVDCAEPPIDIEVEEVITHENFLNDTYKLDDIALVRLARPVKYTDFIKPICLPLEGERSNPGETVLIAGWGLTDKTVAKDVKQRTELQVVDADRCATIIQTLLDLQVTEKQLCALRRWDSCSMDSGGPLMRRSAGQTVWLAEGIASYSTPCGTNDVPGVYTRVSEYLGWILDHMRQ